MGSKTTGSVPLKGSIDIVIEFFNYSINSILYQRGLYPADSFIQQEKYGLPLLVTANHGLKKYLDVVLTQMRLFLESKNVHKIVIVIINLDSMETVERWQFDVDLEREATTTSTSAGSNQTNLNNNLATPTTTTTVDPQRALLKATGSQQQQKSVQEQREILKEIQNNIRGVIRQITASVTFLPTLEGSHSFDILLYTDKDVELPNSEWSDTNARLINNGQHVQLRGFTTHVHRVEPIVSYKTLD